MNLLTRFGIMAQAVSGGKMYLYNAGDECTALTGGWGAYPYRLMSYNTAKSPAINKGSSSITASLSATNTYDRGIASTLNSIDLTNYSSLKIHINSASIPFDMDNNGGISLAVISSLTDGYSNVAEAFFGTNGANTTLTLSDTTISLDVSSINTSKPIAVGFLIRTGYGTATVTFDKIWLE